MSIHVLVPGNLSAVNRQLNTLARKHGFAVINTPEDRNFFHAVSMTMQDAGIQPITHEDLRRRLVTFLRTSDRAADYKHFLPGPEAVQQCLGHKISCLYMF